MLLLHIPKPSSLLYAATEMALLQTKSTQMAMAMPLPSSSSSSPSPSPYPSPSFPNPRPRFSISKSFTCSAISDSDSQQTQQFCSLIASSAVDPPALSRRELAFASGASLLAFPGVALADLDDDYKKETEQVIEQVKKTLTLDKTDPSKPEAVATLRAASNDWVAKYRREKKVAGKPSFSNMYSVLNAISGHYISFGPSSPIPAKRQQRIFEEITDAEKALTRGR